MNICMNNVCIAYQLKGLVTSYLTCFAHKGIMTSQIPSEMSTSLWVESQWVKVKSIFDFVI